MEEKIKIKTFTDLKVWQESHILVIMIYKLTKDFHADHEKQHCCFSLV